MSLSEEIFMKHISKYVMLAALLVMSAVVYSQPSDQMLVDSIAAVAQDPSAPTNSNRFAGLSLFTCAFSDESEDGNIVVFIEVVDGNNVRIVDLGCADVFEMNPETGEFLIYMRNSRTYKMSVDMFKAVE